MQKTAKFIKKLDIMRDDGDARLYRLSEKPEGCESEFVVVSAVPSLIPAGKAKYIAPGNPETYIFSSDENGVVRCWGELEGSFQGGMDHARALRGLGFEIVSDE